MVLFLPAESNSCFILAENKLLEFHLEKEIWRKLEVVDNYAGLCSSYV